MPKIFRLSPERKGALLTLLIIVLLLVGLWVWIGIRIGVWTYPEYDRHVWLIETIPVAHLLWRGDISAGDRADTLIQDWRPDMINRFGPWVEMQWFPNGPSDDGFSFIGVCVIAKNGVLVSASAYSDDRLNDRTFFNTETTNDEAEFIAAQEAHTESLRVRNAVATAGLPILQELGEGIKEGDDAENVIKLWHPRTVTRFGHWTVMSWLPENSSSHAIPLIGVRMIAKNGVLVYANSFSDDGHHTIFFDSETPQDEADFDSAYMAYDESLEAEEVQSTNGMSTAAGSHH